MGKIKVIRVVFSILLVQLFTLSVNADEKADYLKLAQKVRQEVWSSTPADFQKRTVPDGRHTILLSGVEHGLLS